MTKHIVSVTDNADDFFDGRGKWSNRKIVSSANSEVNSVSIGNGTDSSKRWIDSYGCLREKNTKNGRTVVRGGILTGTFTISDSDIEFVDVDIDGNVTFSGSNILITKCRQSKGITISGSNVRITKCTLNITSTAAADFVGILLATTASDVKIEGNTINMAISGNYNDRVKGIYVNDADNVIIDRNRFNISYSPGISSYIQGAIIAVNSVGAILKDNIINCVGTGGSWHCLAALVQGCTRTKFDGNVITTSHNQSYDHGGVIFNSNADSSANDNTMYDTGNSTRGITGTGNTDCCVGRNRTNNGTINVTGTNIITPDNH